MNDYISKPFKLEEIEAVLKKRMLLSVEILTFGLLHFYNFTDSFFVYNSQLNSENDQTANIDLFGIFAC